MSIKSQIEWTETTWNVVTGCTKISQGCQHCYAERMAKRLRAMGLKRYQNGFSVTLHEDLITLPLKWMKPRAIFVNSMGDLFHEEIPLEFIKRVFETMVFCKQHIFQILTKRSKRLLELASALTWTENIWIGVTVESKQVLYRIQDLLQVPSYVRFLSCEPLLEPLHKIHLHGIQWVIVGGESGPGARPIKKVWVNSILEQCQEQNVPFFFKQWGGARKELNGRLLNGRTYDELPNISTKILTSENERPT